VTDPRTGLVAGLLYGLPFTCWLLGQVETGPLPPDLSAAVPVIVVCQAFALLLLPFMGEGRGMIASGLRGAITSAALLIMVPWPALVLVLSTESVSWSELLFAQMAVALWGLFLTGVHILNRRFPRSWRPLAVALSRGGGLVLLLLLLQLYRYHLVAVPPLIPGGV
jgi:hypothetical protein